MRLKRQPQGGLILSLTATERPLLTEVLARFPVVPEDHSCLSREDAILDNATRQEAEKLRREAWAEHLSDTSRLLLRLMEQLAAPPSKQPVTLNLKADSVELLLQVLNDVRVGCWIRLGCPDPLPDPFEDTSHETNPSRRLMDLAGIFESVLLEALGLPEDGGGPADEGEVGVGPE
jgi:hypothetical protein